MNEMIPVIRNQNGVVVFENYDALKSWLVSGAAGYMDKEYDSIQDALDDIAVLETIKDKLSDVKDEINKPLAETNGKLDELLKIIQKPLSKIKEFKREWVKEEKYQKIREYIDQNAGVLGAYKDKIVNSSSFVDDAWLTTKYSDKKWREAVDQKLIQITRDLNTICNTGGAHTAALLARYYETLSLENVKGYLENLQSSVLGKVEVLEDGDNIIGYKILKIYGTHRQMSQVLDELEMLDLEYEEIEDGMPKEFEEITEPSMDSFVAFDIETSGSEGAGNSALPSEITEIGAVKVVDGKVVDVFSELCNPGRPITGMVERITHITNEMVKDKPSVDVIIRKFKEFCGDLPLVGHNIKSMDLHYISKAAKRNGIEFANKYFDTYLYAKKFKDEKGWENVKLEYLAGQFGIKDESHHRACNDAQVNVDVYYKLKEL